MELGIRVGGTDTVQAKVSNEVWEQKQWVHQGVYARQPWKLHGYVVTPVCSSILSRQLSFGVHLASLSPPLIPVHQTDTPGYLGVGGR